MVNRSPAPLVQKILPVTTIGRNPFKPIDNNERFIKPLQSNQNQSVYKDVIDNETLIIGSCDELFNIVKNDSELLTEKEISSMVSILNSIPKACGCVRGTLHESAQGVYQRALPLLQAKPSNFFDLLKQKKNVQKIIFKHRDVVLLEV